MSWSHSLTAAGLAAAAALGIPVHHADGDPRSRLELTLHGGEQAAGRVLASVVLECDPDGGSHPDPAAACGALRASGGDFRTLRARKGVMCPMIYAPVTAEAAGRWEGRPVRWVRSYANRCAAGTASGGVFGF
jgi:subtilisin inhibitor-like